MKSKPNPHIRKIHVQAKVNAEEMRKYLKKAHFHFKGNISKLIRAALDKY